MPLENKDYTKFPSEEDEQTTQPKPLFPLGRTVATPGALATLASLGIEPSTLLDRHICGDWGDMVEEDKAENDFSVDKYLRIFSSYNVAEDVKLWVITEADRSVTTILLPSEY